MESETIMAILSFAFGAWAAVVAWIGNGIRQDLKVVSKELNQYIIATEARLATIEAKMGMVPIHHHLRKEEK